MAISSSRPSVDTHSTDAPDGRSSGTTGSGSHAPMYLHEHIATGQRHLAALTDDSEQSDRRSWSAAMISRRWVGLFCSWQRQHVRSRRGPVQTRHKARYLTLPISTHTIRRSRTTAVPTTSPWLASSPRRYISKRSVAPPHHALAGRAGLRDGRQRIAAAGSAGRVWHPAGLPKGYHTTAQEQSHTMHAPVSSRAAPGPPRGRLRQADGTPHVQRSRSIGPTVSLGAWPRNT
jgi:hypothetical protein